MKKIRFWAAAGAVFAFALVVLHFFVALGDSSAAVSACFLFILNLKTVSETLVRMKMGKMKKHGCTYLATDKNSLIARP
jgi:hypothetical protein